MRACNYCGRDNCEEAVQCSGCGTLLDQAGLAAAPAATRPWRLPLRWREGWIYAVVLTKLPLVYLLNFKPIVRYTGTVGQYRKATNGQSFTTSVTVTYPRWVSLLYRPAFALASDGDNPYGQYLQLWQRVTDPPK